MDLPKLSLTMTVIMNVKKIEGYEDSSSKS
jgi:hypothetical protein